MVDRTLNDRMYMKCSQEEANDLLVAGYDMTILAMRRPYVVIVNLWLRPQLKELMRANAISWICKWNDEWFNTIHKVCTGPLIDLGE